jgi:hypothetical protein
VKLFVVLVKRLPMVFRKWRSTLQCAGQRVEQRVPARKVSRDWVVHVGRPSKLFTQPPQLLGIGGRIPVSQFEARGTPAGLSSQRTVPPSQSAVFHPNSMTRPASNAETVLSMP